MDQVEFDREPLTNLTTMVMAFGGWIDAGRAATGALRHLTRDLRAARREQGVERRRDLRRCQIGKAGEQAAAAVERVAAEVVHPALLRVREHLVRLADPLEPLLGRRIPRVSVRVVLPRQLAVGTADVLRVRVRRHAERDVERGRNAGFFLAIASRYQRRGAAPRRPASAYGNRPAADVNRRKIMRAVTDSGREVVRSEEKAQERLETRHLESALKMASVLGEMKGAAMKIGQMASFIDVDFIPEEQREARRS